MEYVLRTGPVKKDRYTIGFLDDNQNNDFHIQIMSGIVQAAKELDIDIIRFSYYSSHIAYKFSHQVNMALDHIQQYDLDGLMFLGWTKAGAMFNSDFRRRFASLPLFSIGSVFDDIPSVYFAGEDFIRKITEHLIKDHGFKKIAFIEHSRPDKRKDAYISAMKRFNLYDPTLYVSAEELEGLSLMDRNLRAVEILLDERKLEIEAIITLKSEETRYLIDELNRREIKVPDDIAVTGYEDDDIARFSSPGITTVCYPWKELGYYACRNIISLLKNGHIPLVTSLNEYGKTIYRKSCGCMSLVFADQNEISEQRDLLNISRSEVDRIISSLNQKFKSMDVTFEGLVESFLKAYKNEDKRIFLSCLSGFLERVERNKNIEDIVFAIRNEFYPYISNDVKVSLYAGDLFLQAQTIMNRNVFAVHEIRKIETRKTEDSFRRLRELLFTEFRMDNLIDSLEKVLPELEISDCHIFVLSPVFGNETEKEHLYDESIQVFNYTSCKRAETPEKAGKLKEMIADILNTKGENIYLSYLLHVTDEVLGFVLFKPGPMDEIMYQELTVQISTAVRGIQLMNRLNITYKKLVEHAHREGMADIAANTLHNIGNILNSAIVSVNVMEEISKNQISNDMELASSIMRENLDNIISYICADPKGKMLLNFYLKLGIQANKSSQQMLYNLDRLQDRLCAINDEISAQQNYAGIDNKLDEVSIEIIVEDALKLNKASLDYYGITIIRKYDSKFKSHVHRARLFYVITNIISNAEDAMPENCSDKRLIVQTYEDNEGRYLRISDTGVGISRENISLIFNRGFTTKPGKTGFGLYSCEAYMKGMGGSIRAESDGEGKGASFIIKFG